MVDYTVVIMINMYGFVVVVFRRSEPLILNIIIFLWCWVEYGEFDIMPMYYVVKLFVYNIILIVTLHFFAISLMDSSTRKLHDLNLPTSGNYTCI